MSDENQPFPPSDDKIMPPEHDRILWIMAAVGIIGAIAGAMAVSLSSGIGFLLGIVLAFGSYFWLKHSLGKVFAEAGESEKPKVSAIRYLARYLTLGFVVTLIYAVNIVPIIAVILGMAGFGFAVMIDGIIRIFSGTQTEKEL